MPKRKLTMGHVGSPAANSANGLLDVGTSTNPPSEVAGGGGGEKTIVTTAEKARGNTETETGQGPSAIITSSIPGIMSHILDKDNHKVFFEMGHPNHPGGNQVAEVDLQKVYEPAVLAYWSSLGGRDRVTGFRRYWVFAILEHSEIVKRQKASAVAKKGTARKRNDTSRRYKLRVQWVGFSTDSNDTSWETTEHLVDCAEKIIKEYAEKNGLDIGI